ncbi:MAG: hypothetical protein PUG09_09995 [Prevotella sp.]|nr:hypothetical protein [Prevotella sp.]
MGIFAKLFGQSNKEEKVGGMQDYMSLVRVYFQASLAANMGISNLSMLPDLRTFKVMMHVPTMNNKLGIGEKSYCKKMMKEFYNTDDSFFKEIDQSIRRNCHKIQDVQPFLLRFQGFSQELLMLMGNLMKYKLRLPSFFKKSLYVMTEKTVNDIFEKNSYKDPSVMKSVLAVREYDRHLGFSQKWITDFAFQVITLAKKEPKPNQEDTKEKA